MSHQGYLVNAYGTRVSVHTCDECGSIFTICPPKAPDDEGWEACLGLGCDSYDVDRDVDLMFEVEPWRVRRVDR